MRQNCAIIQELYKETNAMYVIIILLLFLWGFFGFGFLNTFFVTLEPVEFQMNCDKLIWHQKKTGRCLDSLHRSVKAIYMCSILQCSAIKYSVIRRFLSAALRKCDMSFFYDHMIKFFGKFEENWN